MRSVVVLLAVVALWEVSDCRKCCGRHHKSLSSHSWGGVPLKRHWRQQPLSQWTSNDNQRNGWPFWKRPWTNLGKWVTGWGDWRPKPSVGEDLHHQPWKLTLVPGRSVEKDGPNVCTYKRLRHRPRHLGPKIFDRHFIIIKKCCPGFAKVSGRKGCPKELKTIVQEAEDQGLSDFVEALSSAGITLPEDGQYTVFAPSNKAIQDFLDSEYVQNKQGLTKHLLHHHIVVGRVEPGRLSTHQSLETMHKDTLVEVTLSSDRKGILVQGAKVQKHFPAKNGILYTIDRVISPPGKTMLQFLSSQPEFSILHSLIKKSGFQFESSSTLFAPTNEAFEKVDSKIFDQKCLDLKDILKYHTVSGKLALQGVSVTNAKIRTVEGSLLKFRKTADSMLIEDSKVLVPDIAVFDGLIQIIDQVLLPMKAYDVVSIAKLMNETEFVTLLKETEMDERLKKDGNFTLFVPSNEALRRDAVKDAIEEASPTELESIVRFHAMDSILRMQDFRNEKLFDTLSPGDKLRTNIYKYGTVLTVNGVALRFMPIQACNGLVHPIEDILLPPKQTIMQILDSMHESHSHTILMSLFRKANLSSLLSGPGPITLFAPTNEAFNVLQNKNITTGNDVSSIAKLLKHHIIPRTLYSVALTPRMRSVSHLLHYFSTIHVPPLYGNHLGFSWVSGHLQVNNVNVTESDVTATNGVLHIIDRVLE